MSRETGSFMERFAEKLEFPKDVIMDVPKIILIGNIQLNIENYLGLIEYNSTNIRVNTSIGIFKIAGIGLMIKSIVAEEIVITGNIEYIDISC